MRVTVHYFSVLRERMGQCEQSIEVEDGRAVGALYLRLFPADQNGVLPVMFAVNQEYVDGDHILQDGDEVAFIPPLGGG